MDKRRRMTATMLAALAVMLAAGLSTETSAAGARLVVTLDEPFVVDGTVYPAGSLSLRPARALNPTTMLNEVWVGNRCLGLLAASRGEEPRLEASRNAVLFSRDERGRLVLRGFAYRTDGPGDRYRFAMLASRKVNAATAFDAGSPPILIAARTTR